MSAEVAEYLRLITSEHQGSPNFMAAVEALTAFAADERNLLTELPPDFDVDAAVGVQLDAVGLWAGVTRIVTVTPSEAFPIPADPYQVSFTDAVFRRLIKARVLANRWDGSPGQAVTILAAFYEPGGTHAAVVDNQDMSIDLYLTGKRATAGEASVIAQMLLPVRPTGVRIRNTFIAADGYALFGLDIANVFINGPDLGSFWETF